MSETSPLDVGAVRRDHELIEALRSRTPVPDEDVAVRLLGRARR
jgi:hypothetical protein